MKTAQKFLQDWEKKNNPFYPSECRWDRLKVNQFAKAYDDYVGLVWDKSGKVYNIKNNGEKMKKNELFN